MSTKKQKYRTVILDQPIEFTDPITGEVRKASRMIVPYGYKDKDFCKVYYHTIQSLSKLPRSSQKVFDWLLENMDFENKVYVLNQKRLAEELELAYITVRKALNELKKHGFINKLENGLYMVNPQLACKTENPNDLYIQFLNVNSKEYKELMEKIKENEKMGTNS